MHLLSDEQTAESEQFTLRFVPKVWAHDSIFSVLARKTLFSDLAMCNMPDAYKHFEACMPLEAVEYQSPSIIQHGTSVMQNQSLKICSTS